MPGYSRHPTDSRQAEITRLKFFVRVMLVHILFLLTFHQGLASEVYKIVDKDGNVTYSNEPPSTEDTTSVEVLDTQPAPSEEEVQAAIDRQKAIEDEFEKLDEQRAKEIEARQQSSGNTTFIVNDNDVIIGVPFHGRWGPRYPGAPVAPGAPTAPGAPVAPSYPPGHPVHLPARPKRGP